MSHCLVRATIIPEVIKLIGDKYGWDENQALDAFYTSATGASLADDETGLYGQSALFIFGLFMEEQSEKTN